MNGINKADENEFVGDSGEEIRPYSLGRDITANFDSSVISYPKDVLSLNRKKLSDEKLVRLFINIEDEEAFNEIVSRYKNRIYTMALRITRNPSDAEDVMQEVFLTLVEKLHNFREESKFSSWIYRVVANASYMHLRSNKNSNKDLCLDEYAPYDEEGKLRGVKDKDWSSRPDNVLFSKESLEIIEKAVGELPDPHRLVIILRDIEEFSNEEVAEILDISIPAVKSRLHRGRLLLRDKISDYFYGVDKKSNVSLQ